METCIRSLHRLIGHTPWSLAVVSVLVFAICVSRIRAAGSGGVSGTVSNAATGNLLEGAVITVPQLGVSILTDNTGRYVLNEVPEGRHEIVATYTGLDPTRAVVQVTAAARAVQNFDLTTAIYQMQQFKVTGEREGNALALTAQRNARNAKNVVAMDTFGNLPNMSAGELAIRLPGVAGNLDDEGNITGPTIRGMAPNLNRFTIDGGLMASSAGLNRQFQFQSMTGAMFEQMELVKGHTPDKGADSLGGTINMKTRSPLRLQGKRRFTYSFGLRWAPPFTEQIPLRREDPIHPLLNASYEEVFDVGGGSRNLGVAVNAFYSENVSGRYRTLRDFQNTTSQPAYLWDYRTLDGYNNRKQTSFNLKADYRVSPSTKLAANVIYNDAFEPTHRRYEVRAFTSQTIATLDANGMPTGTGAILPGYTDKITQVRNVPASTVQLTETIGSFLNRTRSVDLGAEHELGRLKLDYNAAYSEAHVKLRDSGGGIMTSSITGVGWIIDRTESEMYPKFTQTDGQSIANYANYTPGQITTRGNGTKRESEVSEFRANARYTLPTTFPSGLKAGGQWREQTAREAGTPQRYNYIGAQKLQASGMKTWDAEKTGRIIPYLDNRTFFSSNNVFVDPTLWREDVYFRETGKYTDTRDATETVAAGYIMADAMIGKLGLLTGVRVEKTDIESFGWVRAHAGSSTADRNADPVGAAQRDYANTARRLDGRYTESFPSVHATYDVTPKIKALASWSTSFGRPGFENYLPNETFSDAARTLTINNPSLRPQLADNWDLQLDYYFEPVGRLSVGWFHKSISDYIVTGIESGTVGAGNDNGYNGEYINYTILATDNAGTATVQGWEFSYEQQFSFLPGLLKGLGLSLNYTLLKTQGDFGGTTMRDGDEVAGFVPRTGNASLFYRYGDFGTRVLVNYTSDYLENFAAAGVARYQYAAERTTVNLGFTYRVRPECSLFCDVTNLFGAHQESYRYIPSQPSRFILNGTTITFGVSGRF